MRNDLHAFIIKPLNSIMDALKKIDKNKSGFVIAVDNDFTVLGTLTDGDLRRAFISGIGINDMVDHVYRREFKYVRLSEDISVVSEMFKNESIKFLPIIDEENKLCNIITKNQMHALLLQDIHADLNYDFLSLNDSIIDYEIYQKPWGFYKTTAMNDYFQSKILSLRPNAELSLQSHEHREEYWIVAHGNGIVQLDDKRKKVQRGSSVFIPKQCKHRLINTNDKESLIITEVQLGEYFGEDDIIRYEDKYRRV